MPYTYDDASRHGTNRHELASSTNKSQAMVRWKYMRGGGRSCKPWPSTTVEPTSVKPSRRRASAGTHPPTAH